MPPEAGLKLPTPATLSAEIASTWEPKEPQGKPLLILLAGFQGSGKTTVAKALQNEFGLTLISSDVIRHHLFAKGFSFSRKFAEIVENTRDQLTRMAIEQGRPTVVDTNMTPQRIKNTLYMLKQNNQYALIKVLLNSSTDELRRRVAVRLQAEDAYTGTIEELESSLETHGTLPEEVYDIICDTTDAAPDQITKTVVEKVKHLI
ncbi:MAG: AAA family ATPase [Candidatus Curtissbacteria bacterium]